MAAIKMTFSPPPNRPYIAGWAGILGSGGTTPDAGRPLPPAVRGTLEFRPATRDASRGRFLQIELVRLETLPASQQETRVVIGAPITVWRVGGGGGGSSDGGGSGGGGGKEKDWDYCPPADFPFHLPIVPLNLPGSLDLKPKGGGIRYELQATFHQKPKTGLFHSNKAADPTTVASQAIHIFKHEMLSAWPVYHVPETRTASQDELELIVSRPGCAYGHGDRMEVIASLKSTRPKPLKLRGFKVELTEVVVLRPPPAKGVTKQATFNRPRVVESVEIRVNERIARTEEIRRPLAMLLNPAKVANHTTRGGKTLEVHFELTVTAIMEGTGDIKVEKMPCVIGPHGKQRARDLVDQIGYVDALCNRGVRPPASRSPSVISSQPTPSLRSAHGSPYPGSPYPGSPGMGPSSPGPNGVVPGSPFLAPPSAPGSPFLTAPNAGVMAAAPVAPPAVRSNHFSPYPALPPSAAVALQGQGPRDRQSYAAPPTQFQQDQMMLAQQQQQQRPRHSVQPFATARPVSADSSSLFSYNPSLAHSQGEIIAPVRDIRSDAGHPSNRLYRPDSRTSAHVPYGGAQGLPGVGHMQPQQQQQRSPQPMGSFQPFQQQQPQPPHDTRHLSYQSSRPPAPARSSSGTSHLTMTSNGVGSGVNNAPPPQVRVESPARTTATSEKSPRPLTTSSRASYVHVDAGPVKLAPNGEVISTASSSSAATSPVTQQAPTERWSHAEAEKERLFQEARRSAALTQLSGGAELSQIGLAPVVAPTALPAAETTPSEEPPSYSPPEPTNPIGQEAILAAVEGKLRDKPLAEKSESSSQPQAGSSSSASVSQPEANSFRTALAPLSEKEQLRRYEEARSQMRNSYQGPSTSSQMDASSFAQSHRRGASMASVPTFPSAEAEKAALARRQAEETRRYEEAQRRVSMKATLGSTGRHSDDDHGTDQGTYESDFGGSSSHATSSRPRTSNGHSSAFPSAEEEKRMMKERYESAVKAMEDARLSYPMTSIDSNTSRHSYDVRSETPILREGKGKAVAITNPEPAPPVLPPRPPQEYKELLSPTLDGPAPVLPLPQVGMPMPGMFYGYPTYPAMPQVGPAQMPNFGHQ